MWQERVGPAAPAARLTVAAVQGGGRTGRAKRVRQWTYAVTFEWQGIPETVEGVVSGKWAEAGTRALAEAVKGKRTKRQADQVVLVLTAVK